MLYFPDIYSEFFSSYHTCNDAIPLLPHNNVHAHAHKCIVPTQQRYAPFMCMCINDNLVHAPTYLHQSVTVTIQGSKTRSLVCHCCVISKMSFATCPETRLLYCTEARVDKDKYRNTCTNTCTNTRIPY